MFASLFRKSQPVSTIRNRSPRAQLGLENLEDRTVPSTLLGNLGPAGDGAQLFGRAGSSGIEVPAGQVSMSPTGIGRAGGVELVTIAGGARGGVDMDPLDADRADGSYQPSKIGEEMPALFSLLGGAMGGVVMGGSLRSGNEIPAINGAKAPGVFGGAGGGVVLATGAESAMAHASAFAEFDADGAGEINLFCGLGKLQELPQ